MTDQYELQFFENRSTPQVLKNGEPPRPKKNYGKATTRRPANESELKTISSGRWVRVDEAGNTPKSPDYKKTGYRPWLVQPVSKNSAFGVVHKKLSPNDVAVKLANKAGDKASASFARKLELKRLAHTYKQPVSKRTIFNPHAPKRGIKWALHPVEYARSEHIGLLTKPKRKKPKGKLRRAIEGNLAASVKTGAVDNSAMAGNGILRMFS